MTPATTSCCLSPLQTVLLLVWCVADCQYSRPVGQLSEKQPSHSIATRFFRFCYKPVGPTHPASRGSKHTICRSQSFLIRSMTESEQLIANQADLEAFVRFVSQTGPSGTSCHPTVAVAPAVDLKQLCLRQQPSLTCRCLSPCRQPAGERQVTDRLKGVLAETAVTGVIRWVLLAALVRHSVVCAELCCVPSHFAQPPPNTAAAVVSRTLCCRQTNPMNQSVAK